MERIMKEREGLKTYQNAVDDLKKGYPRINHLKDFLSVSPLSGKTVNITYKQKMAGQKFDSKLGITFLFQKL